MDGRRVVVVAYDGACLTDVACVVDVLDTANRLLDGAAYRVQVASPGGRPFRTSAGVVVLPALDATRARGPIDTVVVAGGVFDPPAVRDPHLLEDIARLARTSRRVASVCTGAQFLAAAGLLDGRRVTTHWAFAAELGRRFPAVLVDPAPLYVRDGDVYTSAGVTSALDLMLALVEEDHGAPVARNVARMLVTYMQRPGNQAQVSMFVAPPPPEHGVTRRATQLVETHLDGEWSAATLAAAVGVSPRHLSRLFADGLGVTPAAYVRAARCQAATALLATTNLSLEAVATRCGLRSAARLRDLLVGAIGITPSAYRRSQRVPSEQRGGRPRPIRPDAGQDW